jgi:hypothetical protein
MEAVPSKFTVSFGLALALASVANAVLVIAKEKVPTVMGGMQKMAGHHWISHSAIILVVFAAFGCILAKANSGRGLQINAPRLLGVIISGVLLGGLIIAGFYLING